MLAKCPNSVRVLRLLNFGKQKFLDASLSIAPIGGIFARFAQNSGRLPPQINALYRWQYSLGADFAKNAT